MSKAKSIEEILSEWDAFERPEDGTKYRHYKGGEYEIVATGFLEDSEAPCVIYRSIEKNIIWVRTAKNFLESVESGGQTLPRFSKL